MNAYNTHKSLIKAFYAGEKIDARHLSTARAQIERNAARKAKLAKPGKLVAR